MLRIKLNIKIIRAQQLLFYDKGISLYNTHDNLLYY